MWRARDMHYKMQYHSGTCNDTCVWFDECTYVISYIAICLLPFTPSYYRDTFNTISALIYVVQISWVLRMGCHIIPTPAIHLHCMTGIQIKYIFKATPFSKIFIDKNCSIYTNELTCASYYILCCLWRKQGWG